MNATADTHQTAELRTVYRIIAGDRVIYPGKTPPRPADHAFYRHNGEDFWRVDNSEDIGGDYLGTEHFISLMEAAERQFELRQKFARMRENAMKRIQIQIANGKMRRPSNASQSQEEH